MLEILCTVFKNLNVGTVRVFNLNEMNTEALRIFYYLTAPHSFLVHCWTPSPVTQRRRCVTREGVQNWTNSFHVHGRDPKLMVGHFSLTYNFFSCFLYSTFSFVLTKEGRP